MALAKKAAAKQDGRKPLAQQAALVTGGGRGIGRAIAVRLAALGADVAICGRTPAALEATAAALRSAGVRALSGAADVRRAREVAEFVARVETELGPVAVLVNCAGIGIFGPAHERTEEEWDHVLDTNLKGVWLMSRAVVPSMIQRQRGHIINISSLAGKNVFPGGGLYSASKWGLQGLSATMAEELRDHGIRVCVISPGSVATEFSQQAGRDPSKKLQPDDVAYAVEMVLLQGPQSFMSQIDLRPLRKP